ncbi:MAG: mammalian cell entry protein [Mycobacterium sp.]
MVLVGRVRIAALTAMVAALAGLTGWLGLRDHQDRADQRLRQEMVQAARQGAVNLTTIDYRRAEQDVQRILDSSTGAFRDDFAARAGSFIDAAQKTQSTSVGTVTEAGLESVSGDEGRVLVTLTVMTSNRGVPEQQPQAWRMRVTVANTGEGLKVAEVEFVP